MEPPVLLVQPAPKVRLARQVHKGQQVLPELQEPLEPPAPKVRQVLPEQPAYKVRPAQQVLKARHELTELPFSTE